MNKENEMIVLGQISQRVSQLNDILYTGCVISGQLVQQNNMNDINTLALRLENKSLSNRVIGFTNIYNKIISKCNWPHIQQKKNLIFDINQHLLDYYNVLQGVAGKTIDQVGGVAVVSPAGRFNVMN